MFHEVQRQSMQVSGSSGLIGKLRSQQAAQSTPTPLRPKIWHRPNWPARSCWNWKPLLQSTWWPYRRQLLVAEGFSGKCQRTSAQACIFYRDTFWKLVHPDPLNSPAGRSRKSRALEADANLKTWNPCPGARGLERMRCVPIKL